MSAMKELLLSSQERQPTETCQECGHPKRGGYCYYCGTGKRPRKSAAQRAEDEARALSIWREAVPITGTLAERYLRQHRKIEMLPPGDALRFHPRCPFDYRQRVAAMVALLSDADGRPCGIHRTPLTPDGAKAQGARAYGTFWRTAIRLWPDPVEGRLTVGEGIETTLSAIQMMPNLAPAWAAGTAENLGMFPILDSVSELFVLADNDDEESGRIGQKRAKKLAGRYSAWAKRVTVLRPRVGKDFNDILRGATP
jgi:putative DNA primase/helicase